MQKRKSRERTCAVAVRYFPRFFRVPRIMPTSGAGALVKWAQRMLTIITYIHTTIGCREPHVIAAGRPWLSLFMARIYIYRFSFRSFFRFPGKRRLRYTVSSRRRFPSADDLSPGMRRGQTHVAEISKANVCEFRAFHWRISNCKSALLSAPSR